MLLVSNKLHIKKGNIAICLFVIPFISRWLFPSSWELSLTINLLGIPIYILDFMYVAFPFFAKPSLTKWKIPIIILLCIYFLVGLLGHIQYPTYPISIILVTNQPIIPALILILIYPFTREQIFFVKNLFILTFIILSIEIILGTLGFVDFGTRSSYNFNDIFRISTTIGAATGTGVVMFMLGGMIISVYLKGKQRIIFTILFIITIALTISRGPFLSLILFIIILLFRDLQNNKNKLITIFGVIGIAIILVYTGIFNPMFQRVEAQSSDISTGRDIFFLDALHLIKEHLFFGVGFGNVFQEKDLMNAPFTPFSFIPTHNYYLIVLAESGIIGAFILLCVFLLLFTRMNYKDSYIYYVILITHIVLMNVEGIFVCKEYAFMLAMLYSIGIYKLEHT